jgi:hypothetical protein
MTDTELEWARDECWRELFKIREQLDGDDWSGDALEE